MMALPTVAPGEETAALVRWIETLKVPTGMLEGRYFAVPDYLRDFYAAVFANREVYSTQGRANAKSTAVALLFLAHMIPGAPFVRDHWRAAVVSLTGENAAELHRLMREICETNGISEEIVRFLQNPMRARAVGGQTVEFKAAEKHSGQSIGVDMAVIDEAGGLEERHRELWNAMYSSISKRRGKFIAVGYRGAGPMFAEAFRRAGDPAVACIEFAGDPALPIDDPANWALGNPGLAAGIKDSEYMALAARKALANGGKDRRDFETFDLNIPKSSGKQMLLYPAELAACVVEADQLPPREGRVFAGADLADYDDMSVVVAIWESGRCEVFAAWPSEPPLAERAAKDSANANDYMTMLELGELRLYDGVNLPVDKFIADVAKALDGYPVHLALDRFRKKVSVFALKRAGVSWAVTWRGMGRGEKADGSYDVSAVRRMFRERRIKLRQSAVIASAMMNTEIGEDTGGNMSINKRSARKGKNDAVSALALACGLYESDRMHNEATAASGGVYLGRI